MKEIKQKLIDMAKEQWGNDITPCGQHTTLEECFRIHGSKLFLYFNVKNGSTRAVTHHLVLENVDEQT
jgi:hypothetical protein